jgi:hypothetical protein
LGNKGVQTLPTVSTCGKNHLARVVIEEISPEISSI